MARFVKIGNELFNLDHISKANINCDGRGGIAIVCGATGTIREGDQRSLSAGQMSAVEGNVRFFTDDVAKKLIAKLLEESEDLNPAKPAK